MSSFDNFLRTRKGSSVEEFDNSEEVSHFQFDIHENLSLFLFLFIRLCLYLSFVLGILIARVIVQRNGVKQRKRDQKPSSALP